MNPAAPTILFAVSPRKPPYFVNDPESWFSDERVRGDVPDMYSEEDYRIFAEQASDLGWEYRNRGRQMIASYFLGLVSAAETHADEVRNRVEDRAASVDISIPFDETAPLEHRKDDLTTILARVLPLTDPFESPGERVSDLWRKVLIDLLYQRDELRRRGRIL